MMLPLAKQSAFLIALPLPKRAGECRKLRLGLLVDNLAKMWSVPSVLPSSATIISYEVEMALTDRSSSFTQFSIRKASLYAGNKIEISFSGLARLKLSAFAYLKSILPDLNDFCIFAGKRNRIWFCMKP
jgi:hypothetical protein